MLLYIHWECDRFPRTLLLLQGEKNIISSLSLRYHHKCRRSHSDFIIYIPLLKRDIKIEVSDYSLPKVTKEG
ncbi:MAG: hypothetical protein NHB32_00190 [Fischerella sp. CENA71]|nr:hypothetical protein [Fischerella sp. CENA71]